MPSQKPRLYLTLSNELREALADLADAKDRPVTKVVTELLEALIPQLQGLAKLERATQSGNQSTVRAALRDMIGQTAAEMMTASQEDMFRVKKRKKRAAAA